MPVFSVDTHLFRELGDLLVGRDSTALFELIKNAYDADASKVTVTGTNLQDKRRGEISIVDDGCGMNEDTFRKGFLRVASRLKDAGERRSGHYHRRFTGAKGIGRLSAHKLARLLQVVSTGGTAGRKYLKGINATIDWDAIEQVETLDDLEPDKQVIIRSVDHEERTATGTQINLRKLRRAWTPEERETFVAECQSFSPPQELTEDLSESILSETLLFDMPTVREMSGDDPGFTLELQGEFASGQSLWPTIRKTSHWVIEIEAKPETEDDDAEIKFGFAPTTRALEKNPTWESREFTVPHPRPELGPFFQARIFLQADPKANPGERQRIRNESGIRVYVEGFRILPYGEQGNDWLSLDSDYTRRSKLDFGKVVDAIYGEDEEEDAHWEELTLPNRSYFGGVFFTQEGASSLRPLINREGFLPDESYAFVRDTIRRGIDLSTRVRAAASFHEREAARAERQKRRERLRAVEVDIGGEEAGTGRESAPEPLQTTVIQLTSLLDRVQELLADNEIQGADELLEAIPPTVETLRDSAERVAEEAPMIRVLAAVGTQMAAFVHEIRTVLNSSRSIESALEALIARATKISQDLQRRIQTIHEAVGELRRHLERQAAYLLDIVSPDSRRRRSQQKLTERFDAGVQMLQTVADTRKIKIENAIPPELKTQPMFPAELTTIFSNLLSNAIKAAKANGRIRATARKEKNELIVRVENTGVAVNLAIAERWFRPFESSTTEVDADLGQGMGLGLTITRNMLEPYGATIQFVQPSKGFSTAVQMTFSG